MIVLHFAGGMDISRYPVFRDRFLEVAEPLEPVIVDLSEVDLVDSTFLTELLLFARRCESARSPVGVVVRHPSVLRIFSLAHLEHRLRLFASTDEAVHELEREAASR